MQKDVDYVVEDGQVVIVDSFTGRLMKGRRYSEGLHQAIEGTRHTGKFFVHPEVVLERNRRQGHAFVLNLKPFLRFKTLTM